MLHTAEVEKLNSILTPFFFFGETMQNIGIDWQEKAQCVIAGIVGCSAVHITEGVGGCLFRGPG